MYSKIKINGYCDVNYIWSKSGQLDDVEINAVETKGIHSPVWDTTTVTLSIFKDSTEGNTNIETGNIVGYAIYRKRVDENKLYYVTQVNAINTEIYDFNVQNRNEFVYYVTPIVKDENENLTYSSHIESNPISINWDCITICDLIPSENDNEYIVDIENIWEFSLNIQRKPITPTFNKRVVTGFGQFPKVSVDNLNYLKLGFEALLGDVSCNGDYINDDIDKIEKWAKFCNNGNMKLLKDLKGNVIPCDIENTTLQDNENTIQPITTISFNIVQLDDRKNISAYSFEV